MVQNRDSSSIIPSNDYTDFSEYPITDVDNSTRSESSWRPLGLKDEEVVLVKKSENKHLEAQLRKTETLPRQSGLGDPS